MKISKRTMQVLKQYSQINQSIRIKVGNVLSTKSVAENILAETKVEESFEKEFSIYNLNEFLSAVSLFDNPDLEFSEKYVTIREEGARRGGLKYYYCNPSLIVYPTKSVVIPAEMVDVQFVVSEQQLSKLNKAGSVLGVQDLCVACDDEGISLIVEDRTNPSSNDFEVRVSEFPVDPNEFYFKLDNLKLLPGDYEVLVTKKGIGMFKSVDGTCSVAIALET